MRCAAATSWVQKVLLRANMSRTSSVCRSAVVCRHCYCTANHRVVLAVHRYHGCMAYAAVSALLAWPWFVYTVYEVDTGRWFVSWRCAWLLCLGGSKHCMDVQRLYGSGRNKSPADL